MSDRNESRSAGEPAEPPLVVRGDGFEVAVQAHAVQRAARLWAYVVRNRRRWTDSEAATAMADRSRDHLRQLGLGPDALSQLAAGDLAEVAFMASHDDSLWLMPWEYLLTASTESLRRQPLCVARHLEVRSRQPVVASGPVLFVEVTPQKLLERRVRISFESERRLVQSSLGVSDRHFLVEQNPTPQALRERIMAVEPEVVHISAIDAHQGAQLMELRDSPGDGLYLWGRSKPVDPVELAQIVTAGRHKPSLISCNFFNSGVRIAARMVEAGAAAAVGFQDSFDDTLAEVLFANFYTVWRSTGSLRAGLRASLVDLPLLDIKGTGVVLWSRASILNEPKRVAKAPASTRCVSSQMRHG